MRIVVTTFKGAPLAEPIQAEFGAGGGTIGREAGNRLMLPDPERHISRVQARVLVEGGSYMLEDLGGNPTLVNDRPVGRGTRVRLNDGDRVCVGQYEMRVDQSRAQQAAAGEGARSAGSDPLGLFGGASSGGLDPFGAPPRSPSLTPPPAEDPFGVFFNAAAAPPEPPRSAASLPDPFAPAPRPVAPPPAVMGSVPGLDASVDTLFGIRTGEGSKDPFAGTSLSGNAPPSLGQAPVVDDPLALFGGAVRDAVPNPVRDDASLLAENIGLPRPLATPVSPPAPERVAEVPPAPEPAPAAVTLSPESPVRDVAGATPPGAGIVLSWSASEGASGAPAPAREMGALPQTEIYERRKDAPPSTPRPPRAAGAQAFDVVLTPPPSLSPAAVPTDPIPEPAAPAAAAPVEPAAPDVQAALLAAFQRGLGMPIYAHGGLTPERMEQLGVVVRESVAGTMGLLKARALTKREFRADMTMIVSRENNPLKFAPDLEFALFQLLEPKGGGFLAAEPAMRDAYLDLRSHQFGFLAGMRAAIGGLIERFKPEVLEKRISHGGFLASVLPGARKARLWDFYEQHYAAISQEAEDDFDALFGREFLKAYEAQIERLRDEAEEQ